MDQKKDWTVLQKCFRASELIIEATELMAVQLQDGSNVSYSPEHGLQLIDAYERLTAVMRSMSGEPALAE